MSNISPVGIWKNPLDNSSFSSINYDCDLDKSQSSCSQVSNDHKGFSIKDICPEASFSSESKHQRIASQQIDLLSPSVLFAHIRKNSKQSFHDRKYSMQVHENEELNSTRMQTSLSRRVSDCDLSHVPVPAPPPEPKEIKMERNENLNFCKYCNKEVETRIKFPEDSKAESLLLETVSMIFMCWNPNWLNNLRVKTCIECGFAI